MVDFYFHYLRVVLKCKEKNTNRKLSILNEKICHLSPHSLSPQKKNDLIFIMYIMWHEKKNIFLIIIHVSILYSYNDLLLWNILCLSEVAKNISKSFSLTLTLISLWHQWSYHIFLSHTSVMIHLILSLFLLKNVLIYISHLYKISEEASNQFHVVSSPYTCSFSYLCLVQMRYLLFLVEKAL